MCDSFVFYRSFYENLKKLDSNSMRETLVAICEYALNDKDTELDGVGDIIFSMAKPQLDANKKRREDGKKGGRPKKEKSEDPEDKSIEDNDKKPVVSKIKTSGFQNKNHRIQNQKPNVNVNVNDNVNVNVNENENAHVNLKEINQEKSNDFSCMCVSIIDYLNKKCHTHYRPTNENTRKSIKGRMNEGYCLEDFLTVIDKKADEWLGTEFEKHLNPETLFRPKHFEKYLNQNVITKGVKNFAIGSSRTDYGELEKILLEN